MNWGWKIALGYSAFVLFILYMVYKASGVDFQLVTPDYYNQEIAFQKQIDKTDAAKTAGHDVEVLIEEDQLILKFEPSAKGSPAAGLIHFFRASEQALDRTFEWAADENGMMKIERSEFQRGLYTFKLDAELNGTGIYIEKPVFIP